MVRCLGHDHTTTIKGVTFLGPRGEFVASGSECSRIFIWDSKNGNPLTALEGHLNTVNNVIVPSSSVGEIGGGFRMASAGLESTVNLWNVSYSEKIKQIRGKVLPGLMETNIENMERIEKLMQEREDEG